jgi:Fe-S-cluster-containing hydrogenase component 2
LRTTGVPESHDTDRITPGPERLRKGPVAIIECFQEIPCDPCAHACSHGAIQAFANVCDLPRVDHETCNGCGLCVVKCPGLAIFIVDMSRGDGLAEVKVPYEYVPLPERGERVAATDHEGREVAQAKVLRAQRPSSFDRTALVTLEVPADKALAVRGFRLQPKAGESQ